MGVVSASAPFQKSSSKSGVCGEPPDASSISVLIHGAEPGVFNGLLSSSWAVPRSPTSTAV